MFCLEKWFLRCESLFLCSILFQTLAERSEILSVAELR